MTADTPARVSDEDLLKWEKIAQRATPGPWCIESCGEKGDGSNMIGVAFGPDDINAERPLSGWLKDTDKEGNFIEYYRDEAVAECEHRNRNAGYDATHIATFNPLVILALIRAVRDSRALVQARAERIAALEAEMESKNDKIERLEDGVERRRRKPGETYREIVMFPPLLSQKIHEIGGGSIASHFIIERLEASIMDFCNGLLREAHVRAEAAESSLAETRAKVEGLEKAWRLVRAAAKAYQEQASSHFSDADYDRDGVLAQADVDLDAALSALPEAKPAVQGDKP